MDKQKVEWCIKNLEIFISMLKEELSDTETESKIETTSFETFHPIDNDDDIEYYEEED